MHPPSSLPPIGFAYFFAAQCEVVHRRPNEAAKRKPRVEAGATRGLASVFETELIDGWVRPQTSRASRGSTFEPPRGGFSFFAPRLRALRPRRGRLGMRFNISFLETATLSPGLASSPCASGGRGFFLRSARHRAANIV